MHFNFKRCRILFLIFHVAAEEWSPPLVNDGSMEIRVTDYFSDDESFLFGNSTENSDEEGDEDEYKTIENGNKTHPHHIENNVTGEEWSPRLVNDGSMEIRVTDYFSNDEYVLFGDSDNNSNEEGNEDEDKTAEDGNNAQPYDTDNPVNDTTDEDEVWSPPLVNDGSMEMQATDYFSGDESALFGNSTKESDEETDDATGQSNYGETPQFSLRRLSRASPKNNEVTEDKEDDGPGFSSNVEKENNAGMVREDVEDLDHDAESEMEEMSNEIEDKEKLEGKDDIVMQKPRPLNLELFQLQLKTGKKKLDQWNSLWEKLHQTSYWSTPMISDKATGLQAYPSNEEPAVISNEGAPKQELHHDKVHGIHRQITQNIFRYMALKKGLSFRSGGKRKRKKKRKKKRGGSKKDSFHKGQLEAIKMLIKELNGFKKKMQQENKGDGSGEDNPGGESGHPTQNIFRLMAPQKGLHFRSSSKRKRKNKRKKKRRVSKKISFRKGQLKAIRMLIKELNSIKKKIQEENKGDGSVEVNPGGESGISLSDSLDRALTKTLSQEDSENTDTQSMDPQEYSNDSDKTDTQTAESQENSRSTSDSIYTQSTESQEDSKESGTTDTRSEESQEDSKDNNCTDTQLVDSQEDIDYSKCLETVESQGGKDVTE